MAKFRPVVSQQWVIAPPSANRQGQLKPLTINVPTTKTALLQLLTETYANGATDEQKAAISYALILLNAITWKELALLKMISRQLSTGKSC